MTQDNRSAVIGHVPAHPPLPQHSRLWNPFPGLLFLLMDWQGRASQRKALDDLDARGLDDVGLSPEDQAREVQKPFWRR